MIDEEGYDASERSLLVAGQTCGMVATGLLLLGILVLIVRIASGGSIPP